jgi:isoleucyl-tRNA synthetase
VLLSMRAPEGYSVEREGAHAVALDLAIDQDLLREGRSREIVHAVQNARKSAGLQVEDRIVLAIDGDRALMDAASEHREHIARETLSVDMRIGDGTPPDAGPGHSEQAEVEGLLLGISLSRAGSRLRP